MHTPDNRSEDTLILGFDIGGTTIGVVLGTLEGEILDRMEAPTPVDKPFEAAFEQMISMASQLLDTLESRGLSYPQAVSAAVGGPLDIERGIIYSPPHLPTWDSAPLKERLSKHFQLPVFVEHDGNAGALAEYFFGAGRGVENLVYLTMGTGLGAGIIVDGKLLHGTNDLAGEVGHIRLSDEGPVEYDKAGSWESYCSGAGIAKLARQRDPDRWPAGTPTRQIIESALAGDQNACQLIEEVGEWLGKGLAILVDTLNPELIVIGTLGIVLGDLLLEPARTVLQAEALPEAVTVCRIAPAQLGSDLSSISSIVAAISAYRQKRWRPQWDNQEGEDHLDLVLRSLEAGVVVRQRTIEYLAGQIAHTADLILQVYRQGGKVLVFGNGGSAAASQHLTGELMGRFKAERMPLPAVALSADSMVLTCIGNDYAFDQIFARQVCALAKPDDLLIGITTSGRSANVLEGLRAGRESGALTIALTGERGLVEPVADHVVAVPSESTANIQEEHDAIIHAWCEVIDQYYLLHS
jgi:glucokinase